MPASANLTVRSLVALASLIAIPAVAVWSFSAPPPSPARRGPKPSATARSGAPFSRGLFGDGAAAAAPSAGGLFESSASAADISNDQPVESPLKARPLRDGNLQRTARLEPLKPPVFWTDSAASAATRLDSAQERGDTAAASLETAGASTDENAAPAVAGHRQRDEQRLQPTGRRMTEPSRPQPPARLVAENAAPANTAARPEGLDQERFTAVEERLRALGATHYRLETWGAQGELFRFRAMMSVSSRSNHNRYFEATDRDAMRAAERVVEQVERWRAGR